MTPAEINNLFTQLILLHDPSVQPLDILGTDKIWRTNNMPWSRVVCIAQDKDGSWWGYDHDPMWVVGRGYNVQRGRCRFLAVNTTIIPKQVQMYRIPRS